MSIALLTQPTVLRKYFAYTRQSLLGQWPRKVGQVKVQDTKQSISPEVFEVLPEVPVSSFPMLPPVSTEYVAELTPTSAAETYQALSEDSFSAQASFPESETIQTIPFQADQGYRSFPYEEAVVTETVPVVQTASVADFASTVTAPSALPSAWWKPVAKFFLSAIIVTSLLVAAVIIVPEVYSKIFSSQSSVSEVADAAKQGVEEQPQKSLVPEPYLPPKNPDLPTGTWISIPRIGVHSEVLATENPDEALDKGVWMVPDFGRPGDYSQPTIVAAHRYGWDWWWQTDYWKYNSFYLLTETEPGDLVEVIHDQRKWVYEIYAGEEGKLITDYSADLILYTCKYLNSPLRHFRYARVVIPEK